jgi:UDP-glucose:glycoprotein glucosyltransferase
VVYCGSEDSCDIAFSSSFPRIGFVFILNTDNEVDGTNDAGVALWRAFNYIAEEYDVSEAFISTVHVSLYTT